MTLTQIATLLNEVIVPNLFGEGEDVSHNPITIAEDLRNVVDIGTAIANLSADDLKSYMKDFVVGVFDTYVDTRRYKSETYDLFLSEAEYGGAVQRIKAKLLSASDTPIVSLIDASEDNAPDYLDGKYYGTKFSTKIYTKDVAFQIRYSLSTKYFKQCFTSAAGVQKIVAQIEANVDNTLRNELNQLSRAVLRKMILSAYSGGRYINLITMYNTKMGYTSSDPGYVTLATWAGDENFKIFCQTVVLRLRKYITDYNIKYNDGSVECFSPEEDTRCVLLTEFATELDVALGNVYHTEMVNGLGSYRTINFWQNGTEDLLPYMKSGSLHDQIVEKTADVGDPTTINHVVGIVYDRFSGFITNKEDFTSTQYVGAADFTTFYHHEIKSLAIDPRNVSVVLCLA